MKVINYVHIKNMYAHKDTRIDFQEGKNYLVGPIGSGKTEILQAISFAFFGTSALRDKASFYKNIYVELSFNYKDELFLIKRKINDASFLIFDKSSNAYVEIVNSTSIVNQKIISLLGYNYDIFLLSNFCQQKKLSYFSELTPAKRLQYIDKISGIEESKDLLKYLTFKRKELKDKLTVLKDVANVPTISKDIDLNLDYKKEISILNSKLESINEVYNQINSLQKELNTIDLKIPSKSFDSKYDIFLNISDSFKQECIEYMKTVSEVKNTLLILENKIRDLPTISSKLKNFSLEEIDNLISNYNTKLIHEASNHIKITCSSCNATHDLNTLLNASDCPSVPFKITDLYNARDYVINDYKAIGEDLVASQKELESQYSTLISDTTFSILNSFKSENDFAFTINLNNNLNNLYLENLEKYNNNLILYNSKIEEITLLNSNLDSLLEEQKSNLELRDLYLRYDTEKEIYLNLFELYIQTKDKITSFNIELNLINDLIKDVTNISNEIKQQTIPLINYHSSSFLNLLSKGKMNSIEITEDYDLIVDGFKIAVKSGGQQDLASLAFRLSLSQSIIPGLLPLFIGDEIDSSGGQNESNDIIEALDIISDKGFQLIIVTHEDTTNLENVNIIQL